MMRRSVTLMKLFVMAWGLWMGLCHLQAAYAVTSPSDVSVLRELGQEWGGQLPWSLNTDPCLTPWQGVTCDDSHSNVTHLTLMAMALKGNLTPTVSNLHSLQSLDLSFNPGLSGELPKEIGNLTNLRVLNLQRCQFSGKVPEQFGKLIYLEFLSLTGNNISGEIPPSLGLLSHLHWLDLSENSLTGTLPVSTSSPTNTGLDNLNSILHLHLNNNSLTGSLPVEIFSLPLLVTLFLDSNSFNGTMPPNIGNLKSLQKLRLHSNKLSGQLPSSLNQLNSSDIDSLRLDNNLFSGTLPNLSTLTKLQLLDVSNNRFQSMEVPAWLASLTNLQTIGMAECNLTGQIPSALFGLPLLETLNAQSNFINGTLDLGAKVAPKLQVVSLEHNNITAIRAVLSFLRLGDNPVCNSAPVTANQSMVGNLCENNAPVGQSWEAPTPACGNNLCGQNMTLNPLTCRCAFSFTCNILCTAPSFSVLSDSRILTMRETYSLYFSMKVEQIWVSSAEFTTDGRLLCCVKFFPDGDARAFSSQDEISSVASLLNTQNASLPNVGPYELRTFNRPLQVCSDGVCKSENNLSTLARLGIAFGSAAVGMVVILTILMLVRFRPQRKQIIHPKMGTDDFLSTGRTRLGHELAKIFTLSELEKATNNFHDSLKLGSGGFGTVYKGTLENGSVVAIKKTNQASVRNTKHFRNEVAILSQVNHRNLVKLVGCSLDTDTPFLVYEYIPLGNLSQHLYKDHGNKRCLDWSARLKIAIDASEGLVYLHSAASPHIYHRDVKTSNILLDESFSAKLADFGLSRLVSADATHVTTDAQGTPGYIDPEYHESYHLTDKSDVYSFGVVLLQLLTGLKPVSFDRDLGSANLATFATSMMERGDFESIVDAGMDSDWEFQVRFVAMLACKCVAARRTDRPSMKEVATELQRIRGLQNVQHISLTSEVNNVHSATVSIPSDEAERPLAPRFMNSYDYSTDVTPR